MVSIIEIGKEICKEVFTLENLPINKRKLSNPFNLRQESFLTENEVFLEEVARAREEWIVAKNNFELVFDQDLIDQAVFAMAAAEKRYIYLIKEAQRKRVTTDYLYTSFGENSLY